MDACSTDIRPRLSAVVVSFNSGTCLAQCLDALRAQEADPAALELVVVFDPRGRSADAVSGLRGRVPQVEWIEAPGSTVPEMRTLGLGRSRGELIALLEDDCVTEPGWYQAALEAHRGPELVIGGPVEPGPYRRLRDWAVYFCEYGRFMRPLAPVRDLPLALAGNNVTYKRAALARVPAGGFYDLLVHRAWQQAGVPMGVEETLVIRNVNSWSPAHLTSVPFHHGRTYAAQRLAHAGGFRRLAFGVLALALPLLKVSRIALHTAARRRLVGRLVLASPWVAVFTISWSLGEAAGYLAGPGGSASKWR